MQGDQNAAERVRNEAREQERRLKQLERAVGDMKYKATGEESELNQVKNQFDNERRKSMGVEQAAAQLQKQHVRLAEQLEGVRKEIKETENVLKDLNNKFNDVNKVIDRLEDENNELKAQVQDIHDKSISHINESKNQQKELEQLKITYEKKASLLKQKEAELQNIRDHLNDQRLELSAVGKQANRLEQPGGTGKFISRAGGLGWSNNFNEKPHVIKVLEHESKVYNF